jgi:hypothetical protein
VTLAGEKVPRLAIRSEMSDGTIALGPWLNEGVAKLFVRCVTRCAHKQCL